MFKPGQDQLKLEMKLGIAETANSGRTNGRFDIRKLLLYAQNQHHRCPVNS